MVSENDELTKEVLKRWNKLKRILKSRPLTKSETEFLETWGKQVASYEAEKEEEKQRNARVVTCYEKPRSKNPRWGKS